MILLVFVLIRVVICVWVCLILFFVSWLVVCELEVGLLKMLLKLR